METARGTVERPGDLDGALCLRGTVGDVDRSYYLPSDGERTVGSSPASDLRLPVDGVSREHALLRTIAGALAVEDCGSTNGTFVDGLRVERSTVPVGGELRFGPVRLALEEAVAGDSELGIMIGPPSSTVTDPHAPPSHTAWMADDAEDGGSWLQRLRFPDGYLPGSAPPRKALYRQITRLLRGDLPVLVVGETGAGKERVARILHDSSDRAAAPLVAINCAAIPAELQEAELFGIGSGVATGVKQRPGSFELADGGTLLLDEVGEMTLPLQTKMLRILQEKVVQPVGGTARPVDVRIVAATNADLSDRIRRGLFRSDLYYRLAGYVLEVPPLRQCPQDVPQLVEYFLSRYAAETGISIRGVTVAALHRLRSYPWPGNIRELVHEMRRLAYVSGDGQVIDSAMLSPEIRDDTQGPMESATASLNLEPRLRELETRLIHEALRQAGGVRLQAARLLGIHRNSLAHKMKRLGIEG